MTPPPFFIVGAGRSGTTLLRLMLNAHPRLALPPELSYFAKVGGGVGGAADWGRVAPAARVEQAFDRFRDQTPGVFEPTLWEEARAAVAGRPGTLRAPLQAALDVFAQREGVARWGEKSPSNVQWVDVIGALFPTAHVVFLVRDPRAVVASARRFPYYPDDPVVCAYNWLRANTRGHALWAALPAERRRLVRFEDLVTDPERVVGGVLAFLGEAYHPDVLGFYRDAPTAVGPAGVLTAQITRPVSGSRASSWADELDAAAVAAVEAVCGPVMERFGYARSGARLPVRLRASVAARTLYCRAQTARHALGARHPEFGFEPLARTRERIGRLQSLVAR